MLWYLCSDAMLMMNIWSSSLVLTWADDSLVSGSSAVKVTFGRHWEWPLWPSSPEPWRSGCRPSWPELTSLRDSDLRAPATPATPQTGAAWPLTFICFVLFKSEQIRNCVVCFDAPQFNLWCCDRGNRCSGGGFGHHHIQTLGGQVSTRGPPHLCSGHAGISPLPFRHHFCGIVKHSSNLRKRRNSLWDFIFIFFLSFSVVWNNNSQTFQVLTHKITVADVCNPNNRW